MRSSSLMATMRNLSIPIISGVEGVAAGFGASLALAADIIVVGAKAYFLQAFGRVALVPDGGVLWLLARAIGRVRAMELVLLGERLTAEKAAAWGLVTRMVDHDQVETEALWIARRLADGPALAIDLTRRAAWAAAESNFSDTLLLERQFQALAGAHPDHREGVAAFIEKRSPSFAGTR